MNPRVFAEILHKTSNLWRFVKETAIRARNQQNTERREENENFTAAERFNRLSAMRSEARSDGLID